MRAAHGPRRRRPIRLTPLTMRAGRYPSGTRSAHSRASTPGRRRRAWPAAGRCLRSWRAATATRTMPPRRAVRSADSTSVRHHHGSVRNPSPMPSTRPRDCDGDQIGDAGNPASSRKPLRGKPSRCPRTPSSRARRTAGCAGRGVRGRGRRPSAAGWPRGRAVWRTRRGALGGGLVVAVQHDRVAAGSRGRSASRRCRVALQPVAALEPGRDQQATPARRGRRVPGRTDRRRAVCGH